MTQRYRIDVNGFRVRQCKEGEIVPCIRITEGKKIWYAKSVHINGPSDIIQSEFDSENPNKPFIWIETDSEITTGAQLNCAKQPHLGRTITGSNPVALAIFQIYLTVCIAHCYNEISWLAG